MDPTIKLVSIWLFMTWACVAGILATWNVLVHALGDCITAVRSRGNDALASVREQAWTIHARVQKGAGYLISNGPEMVRTLTTSLVQRPAALSESPGKQIEERIEPDIQAGTSEYEKALAVLGYASRDTFTADELKQRYLSMRGTLHPNTGFQNRIFIQQVHDAYALIKRERGWI